MDSTDSKAYEVTEAHTLLQTLSILEVATTYLLNGKSGEMTWEPLRNIIASDPYTCAVYAKEHDLLNTLGWKLLKRHARTARRLIRTLKKSKYRQAKASRNINMDGKFKETMHMPCNLIYKMAIINGGCY